MKKQERWLKLLEVLMKISTTSGIYSESLVKSVGELAQLIGVDDEVKSPPHYLTRREFFNLPLTERNKLLEEQANDPAIIAYYKKMFEPEPPDDAIDGHSTML